MERAKKGSLKGLTCIVEDCSEPMHSKQMCIRHYKQWHRTGKAKSGIKGKHGTPEQRFWTYVQKGGIDECWPWLGNRDKDGYGSLRTPKTQLRAHRLSYQIHKGEIPAGMVIRHTCHNPSCVNPSHLLFGTVLDNNRDKVKAGRSLTNELHPNTKFSNEVVAQVRQASGTSRAIAIQFGISESQVKNIRHHRQRPAINPEDGA